MSKNRFKVIVSFDGLAQDIQRKKGSSEIIVRNIKKLLRRQYIQLEVNSVFTPKTVDKLSDSIQLILDLGVNRLHFSLSIINPWRKSSLNILKREMDKLKTILLKRYKTKGDIPLVDFNPKEKKGFFYCSAGQDRMAVTPDGKLWGCFLFPEYKPHCKDTHQPDEFFFGDLDTFIKNHKDIYPRVSSHYKQLSMDRFKTPHMDCFLCPYLEECGVCPVNISFTGYPLGEIPDYVCQIHKIKIQMDEKFLTEIKKI